ncbi:helix-turn-helix domain-containing protein [Devosia psychrophila]|uniref:DnaA protein helix-turn-helix n=1 Tax=Devosia psychrophila TaxID=728005 RepID=A0A1I1J7P3_9HYPH|nr:helix-turn-helix domain-containing protein [Devosia psychrophila]SFC44607.1 dnaA protein helix-turn-helix [Devosia psychrophila]
MHHTPFPSTIQHAVPWGATAQRNCDRVIALVAQQKSVPIRLLTDANRGRRGAARARQLAMYLSHVVYGRSLAEIGKAFGRDRTTVSYACALIEDMRDDPRFDEEVCALELQLETSMATEVDHVR